MVNDVKVDYYGSPTPMNQVANVSLSDAKTISIQPWEKSMLSVIEKSIFEANLGITPRNDGEKIHLAIPPLTEERRRDLVKKAKGLGEDAKVSIRNARRDAISDVKKQVKNGYPEDSGKDAEGSIQNMVNAFSKKIDDMIKAKETDIMTI